MIQLDLANDCPEDYEGRLVTVYSCKYIIGPTLGEGMERYVHELINLESGLSIDAIGIFRDQVNKPNESFETLKAANGLPGLHDYMLVQAHGGWFEVSDRLTGDSPPEFARFSKAMEEHRYDDLISDCSKVLVDNPFHFVALNFSAAAHDKLGNCTKAFSLITQAMSIEPNRRELKRLAMTVAQKMGRHGRVLQIFADFKLKWPFDHSQDAQACLSMLYSGRPEDSKELELSDGLHELVDRSIDSKIHAEEKILPLQSMIRDQPSSAPFVLATFRQAYADYKYSLVVNMNYFFACLRANSGDEAKNLLEEMWWYRDDTHGWAELLIYYGFTLLLSDDPLKSVEYFSDALSMKNGVIHPIDLPDLPLWWHEGGITWHREDDRIFENLLSSAMQREEALAQNPTARKLLKIYQMRNYSR